MSAVPSLSPVTEVGPRRVHVRHSINALDVITLRSGIPDSVPGRCIDISEAGIGAALAGEMIRNQPVAVELKLPQVALPLRVRAVVRHHSQLRCGLQFVNLSVEQREMIRFWIHRNVPKEPELQPTTPAQPDTPVAQVPIPTRPPAKTRQRIRIRKRSLFALLALMLAIAVVAWWYWERAWRELESSKPGAVQAQTIGKQFLKRIAS